MDTNGEQGNHPVPDEDRASNVLPLPAAARATAGPPWGPDLQQLRAEIAQLRQAIAQLTWDAAVAAKQLREHTHPSMPPRGVTVISMDGGGS